MTEEDKLRTALDEALRRERIAVRELQKMRHRAEIAEKTLELYKRATQDNHNNETVHNTRTDRQAN